MSNSGLWACVATGDTPTMCNRIAFLPLVEDPHRVPPHPHSQVPPPHRPSSQPAAAGAAQPADDVDDRGGEYDVFIRAGLGSGGGGGGGDGEGDRDAPLEPRISAKRVEGVECGGAVLSLTVSKDDRFVMANVRPFMVRSVSERRSVLRLCFLPSAPHAWPTAVSRNDARH